MGGQGRSASDVESLANCLIVAAVAANLVLILYLAARFL